MIHLADESTVRREVRRAYRMAAFAKTDRYSLEQGQQGIRSSGGGIDLESCVTVSQPTSIAVGAMPFEAPFWRAPLLYPADAVVPNLSDSNPLAEPPYNYQLQECSLTLNTTFPAAAASFAVLIRLWRAGVLIGTVATFDASITSFTQHVAVLITTGFGFKLFQPGDIITYQVVVRGAGAACPPFLASIDGQC